MTATEATVPVVDDERSSRLPRVGWHVAGLALVLLLLVPVLGRDSLFSADEGAAVAQARLLSEDRGWTLDHPLPDLDPSGQTFPLENADRVHLDDGRPAGAPFAKHPVYALLLVPFDRAGGVVAMVLTSIMGTVLAAAAAGLLLRRLAPPLAPVAVWATGLATPLFFDSWLLIAHTLGAGLAAVAALAVVRADEGRGGPAIVTAGIAIAGAVLLRNEALLFGVALAAVAGVLGWRRHRIPLQVAGAAVLLGSVAAHQLDRALSAAVSSGAESTFTAGVNGSGFLVGRVVAAVVTLLLPSYGSLGLPDLLLVLTAGSLVGAVVVARCRPGDTDGVRLLAAVAVLAAVGRSVLDPAVVPGLLVAAPALTAGLAAISRRTLLQPTAQLLVGSVAVFAGAVLATQYESGGSGEWGGRYFALALPLVVPVVVLAVRDLLAALPRPAARPLLAGFVVVPLALTVLGGRALVATQERTDHLVVTIEEAAAQVDDPVILSTAGAAPRFAWRSVLDGEAWLLVDLPELEDWLDRLDDEGRDVVVATPDPSAVRDALGRFRTVVDEPLGHGSPWRVFALTGG